MLKKGLRIFKNVGLTFLLIIGVTSCEKDLENIGVDLIDNGAFDVGDTLFKVIAYNSNVDSSKVDNNELLKTPGYLFGVSKDDHFGLLKSTFISQLNLPINGSDFGENPVIDLVMLDIPYYATQDTIQYAVDPLTGEEILDEDGNKIVTPSFRLDSVFGNQDIEFQVSVNRLETFLNVLDPEDPTQNKTYYSDKDYSFSTELFNGSFKPNRNDTVLYVERRYLDDDPSIINDIDTIKSENASPSMKFELDKNFFKTHFVDHQDSNDFINNDNFRKYFKGLYIQGSGSDGSLISFPAPSSTMTIYFTSDETVNEDDDEDLNGNGVNGEDGVTIRQKFSKEYFIGGVRTNKFDRDYLGLPIQNALTNPNKTEGESKLYVQGAAGSEAIIEIIQPEDLEKLKEKGWLINEANLKFYIDTDLDQSHLPNQLYLYLTNTHSIIFDNISNGPDIFGGLLEYDDNGNPESYKFRITDYISNLINLDDDIDQAVKFSLKTFHSTDAGANILDTIVRDYSWLPKSVILNGNNSDKENQRVKLEIFYSE